MPFVEVDGRRILFVHIPRTGGTTVEQWLMRAGSLRLYSTRKPEYGKCTPQHLRYSDIEALLGENYFSYVFSIVRNPYQRVESEYRLRMSLGDQKVGFSEWLDRYLSLRNQDAWILDNHLRPQVEFLGDSVELFHFEDTLEFAMGSVAEACGLPLPRELSTPQVELNVSNIFWSDEDISRVKAAFKSDFEVLGY